MLAEEMRLKKNGVVVRVYEIQDGRAYIFNPEAFQKVNNGWESVKLSQLVPMDFPINSKEYISKTTKNKAKNRMKLMDAIWKTSDGIEWKHENIQEAIQHEIELMAIENETD